jgi:uncharacterized membrane protein YoaK (UPF0700 family)
MQRWPEHSIDLFLLTFAAGTLDALSYLRGHAFTANMTGNTVLLGLSIFGHDRQRLVPCAIALAGFLGGAAIAAGVLTRPVVRMDAAADLRCGLALEIPALCIFSAVWLRDPGGDAFFTPAALLASGACALGIQSVAVRRLRISGVVTTFITGTMTAAVVGVIARKQEPESEGAPQPLLLAAMFVTYVIAAATGAFLYDGQHRVAPFLPVAAAAIVAIHCRPR